MIKGKSGITLIALIITIIILLILAGVSINAVVGDNGLIAQAMESRIVTLIANIIFDIEDDIVDIQAENIPNNIKYTSTEMMYELQNRGILLGKDDYFSDISNLLMQSDINNDRLKGLSIGFNGDIWLDNYKRGKIQLSSNIDVVYSSDGNTKITVIDGTAEEVTKNCRYYLHSLENRNDFVCWVNQYGEIVSTYKDTIIYILNPREEEYTAIYNEDLKKTFQSANFSTNFEQYINWFYGKTLSIKDKNLMGIQSIGYKDENNKLWFEIQSTHNAFGYFYNTDTGNILNSGKRVNYIALFLSDNYNDLLTIDNDFIKNYDAVQIICPSLTDFWYTAQYGPDYNPFIYYPYITLDESDMDPFLLNYQISTPGGLFSTVGNYILGERPDDFLYFDINEGFKIEDWGNETYYFPIIDGEENFQFSSKIDFVLINTNLENGNGTTIMDYIKSELGNDVKRIYYRVGIWYEFIFPYPLTEEEIDDRDLFWFHQDSVGLNHYLSTEDEIYNIEERDQGDFYLYFEPTIKYIDL